MGITVSSVRQPSRPPRTHARYSGADVTAKPFSPPRRVECEFVPLTNDLAILVTEIDANLSHADSLTHGLTDQQFNWRPESGRWSIAECFGHLNLINGADLPQLKTAIDAALAKGVTGEGPFHYGLLSRKFVASMEPPVKRKVKAPKQYLPPSEASLEETISEYRRISAALRALVKKSDGLHLAKVKTRLSGIPVLRMPLGARFNLLTTHDRRHLWQAEQVRNHSDFPK